MTRFLYPANSDLFVQLGLDTDAASIESIIQRYRGARGAIVWGPVLVSSHMQFLREAIKPDAERAQAVGDLALRFTP